MQDYLEGMLNKQETCVADYFKVCKLVNVDRWLSAVDVLAIQWHGKFKMGPLRVENFMDS